MRFGKIIVIIMLSIITKESTGQFVYKFPSPAGRVGPYRGTCSQHYNINRHTHEELCDTIVMKHLGYWRRMALTPMSRDAANGCCNKRGMKLISTEVGVKEDLISRYITDLYGAGDLDFWTSATDRDAPGQFFWENGLKIIENSTLYKFPDEKAKENGDCVLMGIQSESLIYLKTADCEEENPFICQLQPYRKGEPLSEEDMKICDEIDFIDLLDLPNLRWGNKHVRFPVARYCCEKNGWTIPDDSIMDNLQQLLKAYQHPEFQIQTGIQFRYYVEHSIWLGYNDMCKETEFEWNCGKRATYAPELWVDATSPDNEGGMEHCVELALRVGTKRLQINDIECDYKEVYPLCQTDSTCPTKNQFHCQNKRIVNPIDQLEEEKLLCDGLTFQFIGKGEYFEYFLSDQALTFAGVDHCLNKLKYVLASFELPDEIAFLSSRFLNSNASSSGSRKLAKSSAFPQVWNTAHNWLLPPENDIVWDGDNTRPIKSEYRIDVRTHDDIYPMCGKTYKHSGMVGVLSEDCLRKLRFVHKKPFNFPVPPEEVRNRTYSLRNNSYIPPSTTTVSSRVKLTTTPELEPQSTTASVEDDYDYFVEVDDPHPHEDKSNGNNSVPTYTLVCNDEKLLTKYQAKCPDSSLTPDSCPHSKNFSKEIRAKINLQNNRMRAVSVKIAMGTYSPKSHAPQLSFKLFSKTVGVYWKLCPGVTSQFLQTAFHLFFEVHRMTSQGRSEYLTEEDMEWIRNILQKCYSNANSHVFTSDSCLIPIMGERSCSNFICTNSLFEFNIYNSDPLIDIMWFMYELVHSACFPFFSESYRMFHKFSIALMDVFTKDIQIRWSNQIENTTFWKRVLGPDYEYQLLSMQRCNTATIKTAQLNLRLAKQQIPKCIRLQGTDIGD